MKLSASKYKSGEKALSRKEYEKLISVIDNLEDELLIKLAVSTGIRREDMCHGHVKRYRKDKVTKEVITYRAVTGIKVSNINLDDGTLTFHESKKNKDRTIYLATEIITLIKKFLRTQDKREYLFTYSGRTAYRRLNHWCRIAGIPERPFHALRATCVKFCDAAGWSKSEISGLTGDSIKTLEMHYMAASDGDMRSAVREKPII